MGSTKVGFGARSLRYCGTMSGVFGAVRRHAVPSIVAPLFLSACQGSSSNEDSGGPRCIDVGSCRPERCTSNLECSDREICNQPSDPDFDPSAPVGQCVRVACARSEDCQAGQVCTLVGRCAPPACLTSADCAGGERCSGGACGATPTYGADFSCRIRVDRSIATIGATVSFAVDILRSDEFVVDSLFEASSETPTVAASAHGRLVTLGAGSTRLVHANPTCASRAVRVLGLPTTGIRRIIVTGDGHPLAGAQVRTGSQAWVTGASGVVSTTVAFNSLTASIAGYDSVTILGLSSARDVLVPLRRLAAGSPAAAPQRVHSEVPRGPESIPGALVGRPLSTDLGLRENAFAFGISQNYPIGPPRGFTMPSGVLLPLIPSPPAYPSEASCGGPLLPTEIGCYLGDRDSPWLWMIGARGRAQSWYPFWTASSDDLDASDGPPMAPVFGALADLLAEASRTDVASVPGAVLHEEPGPRVFTQVFIPRVSIEDVGAAPLVAAVAVARAPEIGLIPLGIGFNADGTKADPVDGIVPARVLAFGRFSRDMPAGAVALSFQPRVGPTNDEAPTVLLIVGDPQRLSSRSPLELSAAILRSSSFPEQVLLRRDFAHFARVVLDRSSLRLSGLPVANLGRWVRVELEASGARHLVYFRAGPPELVLPVPDVFHRALLAGAAAVVLSVIQFRDEEPWAFGAGADLRDTFGAADTVVVEECSVGGTGHCSLR